MAAILLADVVRIEALGLAARTNELLRPHARTVAVDAGPRFFEERVPIAARPVAAFADHPALRGWARAFKSSTGISSTTSLKRRSPVIPMSAASARPSSILRLNSSAFAGQRAMAFERA